MIIIHNIRTIIYDNQHIVNKFFCVIVPPNGCNALSSEGVCFSYFTSTGINWEDARLKCVASGYDIATVTSTKENSLMYNTATASSICWIGLHDIDTEGTFVWADGSESMYRQWNTDEPNDAGLGEDCVHTSGQPEWNDQSCTFSWSCYFCSTEGKIKLHTLQARYFSIKYLSDISFVVLSFVLCNNQNYLLDLCKQLTYTMKCEKYIYPKGDVF